MNGQAQSGDGAPLLELDLGQIPGLGPVRRAALSRAGIEDLRGLLQMGLEELAAVRGVGAWQARRIREVLRQRGLLVEDSGLEVAPGAGESHESEVIVVREPETVAEATLVAEAVHALEQHAVVEANLEAAVSEISEALQTREEAAAAPRKEASRRSPARRRKQGAPDDQTAKETQRVDAAPAKADSDAPASASASPAETPPPAKAHAEAPEAGPGSAEAPDADTAAASESLQAEIRERRERLPDAALELMEAIRQAAVSKQLTRQVTRLLITTGEFATGERPLTDDCRQRAATALAQAEQALQKAREKQEFGRKAQKELADRIRARRKELEQVLERAGEGSDSEDS